jgi:hypothetical protein
MQPSQIYYFSFKYSSTCFGHPHAHHQELQQLQYQPLVYRQNLVIMLLFVVGSAGRPDYDQQCVCLSAGQPVNLPNIQSAGWGHVRDNCVSSVLRAVRPLFAVVGEMQFEKMVGASGP